MMELRKSGNNTTFYAAIVTDFSNYEISEPKQIEARDELEGKILAMKGYVYGGRKDTPYDGFNLDNPDERQAAEDLLEMELNIMELEITLIDPLEFLP